MSGETDDQRATQPGSRDPAPGRLATVQAFLNTHHDLSSPDGGELLTSPTALSRWLAPRALLSAGARLDANDLRRALEVREGLRAMAYANNDQPLDRYAVATMRRAADGATVRVNISPEGPSFETMRRGGLDGAFGGLFADVAEAMINGSWQQLRACLGRDCGWVFFDRSRNRSARWCAMSVCGSR
jgi:Putative stress-induced transcription regulator/CGNR zinc finger